MHQQRHPERNEEPEGRRMESKDLVDIICMG